MPNTGTEKKPRKPKPPYPAQHQSPPGLESRISPMPRFEAPEYHPAAKLAGKVALVTGGDSGIGRAVAVLFAREGADVALVYLPTESSDAETTARHIEKEGRRALLLPGDLREGVFCETVVRRTVDELGRLDILVNNAAFQKHVSRIEDLGEDQWTRTFDTNVLAMYRLCRAALAHMQPGSSIINTGSIVGLEGKEALLDYGATKGAIHAFTKSLAKQLVPRQIRVNCVAPGPVWTPLNVADQPPEKVAEFGTETKMSRPAQPEEIAPAYVFFASNADSSYVTGEVLTLLGGDTAAA